MIVRLIAQAGVQLDRALFPLLARVAQRGPLPVGELAELAGRDYSTVSRQVTRMQELGLVQREARATDARVSEVALTAQGKAMSRAIDRARTRLMRQLLAAWNPTDVATLSTLLRRLADDALATLARLP